MRKVVVTAASAGIGLATAKAFLAADPGCVVAVTTRDRARLLGAYSEHLHARLRVVVSDDFADPTKLEEAARACVDALDGEVDVLVNNLGAATLGCSLDKTSAADLMWHMNINVTSALIFTQACTEALCRSSGAIVNLSSIAGARGLVGVTPYCVAKGALDQLTRCAALELAPRGVRVNAVAPGTVATTFHERGGLGKAGAAKYYKDGGSAHPLGRVGTPEEVARAIVGVARQTWTTGSIHYVDGGRMLTMSTAEGLGGPR
ncbi:hypothetical protein FNF28_00378 [Cafeteria roenbergensis]|uniref:Ketoreductase (KR) domain-containing protein n=1 Tax=Cafeteria roenbergensis TaxID=33653 RepID=A0A5A8E855_CAFRO|nr:hypothetical protein FNF28_00378 [Cafeteria roenbergensis]